MAGGKYRIVRLIAEGGMGAVYEAEHTVMNKRVAIKWIRPGMSAKARAADRLVQEARAAARIRHPHVVDVYDVEREGDAVYLVMEYLEGEPLSALMARGGMPMHQFIALLLPALRGVAAAHRQGVIHRDIKPDNIYLTRLEDSGAQHAKVLDFGISKLEPRGAEQVPLTRSGSTVGTPTYMSYEQLCGSKEIDGRTDVYAFGVILYEALTGQLPHDADSYPALIVKVTTTTALPARQRNADIPVPLERIISWALAREPQDRIESVQALIRELETFATETGFRADMESAELPNIPPSRGRADADETHLANGSTVFASGLRGSKPTSAVRAPLRGLRARSLAVGVVVLLVGVGSLYALSGQRRNTTVPASLPPDSKTPPPSGAPPPSPDSPTFGPRGLGPWPEPKRGVPVMAPSRSAPPRTGEFAATDIPAPNPKKRNKRALGVRATVEERGASARKRGVESAPSDVAPSAEPPSQQPANLPKPRVSIPAAEDFY